MTAGSPVRWGIIGTANIARAQFLPGLREAGGMAEAVAGRDAARTERYASENGISRAVTGYQALIDDPAIDVLYLALPNSMHAEWTLRALAAGKPVLCEKPLCGTLVDAYRVLDAARDSGVLLWEAFVFPFHPQLERVRKLVADGAIGELMEIKSNFHFQLSSPGNIRYSRELQGGALNDVGCYPIRLAAELFGAAHQAAWAGANWGGEDVDVDTWGVLEYPGGRRLHLSCGMGRSYDTFSTLEGTTGRIHITNPFHPGARDSYQLVAPRSEPVSYPATAGEASFTAAIRHINAVLRGEEEPRLLAVGTALGTARALHDLSESFTARR
ncbi:MAG: Gfo/Idh/MocA family oxidoreductase [Nocardiopsaceae bacterium]|jgi:predicted dehydrogenase|nr:Gfo/Idh/MocA family oxidoreductase [Nocardiopsaceae bacterium]